MENTTLIVPDGELATIAVGDILPVQITTLEESWSQDHEVVAIVPASTLGGSKQIELRSTAL